MAFCLSSIEIDVCVFSAIGPTSHVLLFIRSLPGCHGSGGIKRAILWGAIWADEKNAICLPSAWQLSKCTDSFAKTPLLDEEAFSLWRHEPLCPDFTVKWCERWCEMPNLKSATTKIGETPVSSLNRVTERRDQLWTIHWPTAAVFLFVRVNYYVCSKEDGCLLSN